jgi:DNA-binding CsgD family transcriptional regulator
LVGRREELALCEQALRATDARGVVVAGVAGVGKTRLAQEVLTVAVAAGRPTVQARATVSAQSIPLGALAHLLPAELDRAATTLDLLRRAGAAFGERSAGRPLVLWVDDAHLLDPASATLVLQLVAGGRAFLLVTVRTGEPAPDAVTALWKDEGCEFLELQPLSRAQTSELVELALGGSVEGRSERVLWEMSRGMPLVLRELVLDGIERGVLVEEGGLWRWRGEVAVGRRLTALLAARIGTLSEQERDAAEMVAVGEPVSLSWLEDGAVVDGLLRRGVLEVGGEGGRMEVRFAHPLYGEVVRAEMTAPRAAAVSRRLAHCLEASGLRRPGDVLRLASWRLEGGEDVDAQLLLHAAMSAELASMPALAERFALAAQEADGGFTARFAVARAVAAQGRDAEAERLFCGLQVDATSEQERAMVAERRARLLGASLGRGGEAAAVVKVARAAISDPSWQARLVLTEGWISYRRGRPLEAAEVVVSVLNDPAVDESLRLSAALFGAQVLAQAGRSEEAVALIERWLPVADRLAAEVPRVRAEAAFSHLVALFFAGRLADAGLVATAVYQESLEGGDLEMLGAASLLSGAVALHRGQVTPARKWFRESVAVLREVDTRGMLPWALAMVSQAAGQAGDAAEAASVADEAAGAAGRSPGAWIFSASLEHARAWASVAAGALAEGRASVLRAADIREAHGQLVAAFTDLHDLARIGGADVAAPRLQLLSERVQGTWVRVCADHAAALANMDAAALREAASGFERLGHSLSAAEALFEAAAGFSADGRASSARACAARARALLEHCPGARTPPLTTDNLHTLTKREREIATLAAHGLSNKAIAGRLTVSVRTVENQLQHAYRKLGITSRAELGSVLEVDS